MVFLNFLKCIFLKKKGSAFIRTVRACKIIFNASRILLKSMRSRAFFFFTIKMNLQHSLHMSSRCINKNQANQND